MRRWYLRLLCAVLLSAAFAGPARAELIVIDPNSYADGTDLSTLFDGVTLAHLRNEPNQDGVDGREVYRPIASSVYAVSTYHAPEVLSIGGFATDLLSYDTCSQSISGPLGGECAFYDVLELRFSSPTNFVEINSIWFSDSPDIRAYNAAGDLLDILGAGGGYTASYAQLPDQRGVSTHTLARTQTDISRIVYGGFAGNSTPLRVTYSVPEPTTLGLTGLGLIVAGVCGRRRRARSRR